ncbi:MAG: GNAT family N-acetyltransferase [Pseudonocardia sp.]|nr:GNAT family N-acetyltransferase [Pseudonocardia sp.]
MSRWCAARRRPAVRLRPMRPGDDAVQAVFDGLSARSRYLRFGTPMRRLGDALRRHLADVDGIERAGLVAEAAIAGGWSPVGIARLSTYDPGRAELAVEVVDAWQGRGIGRRLLVAIGELAGQLGHTELTAEVLPENQRVVQLLRRVFPGARASFDGYVVQVRCPIGWSAAALTHEDLLDDLLAR